VAKPKAPRALTEAFAAGVDDRLELAAAEGLMHTPYSGALAACWLAHHDPKRRPCSGPMERFHFIRRETVEDVIWAALREAAVEVGDHSPGTAGYRRPLRREEIWDLIHIAAWDSRNAELGCEHHHRRFDGHAVSPRAPKIIVPFPQLPGHVLDYVDDYGFRGAGWLVERFPGG